MKRAVALFVAVAATAHADDPAEPPKVVTKALIRDIANGKLPLGKLVDLDRGLIVVEFWQGCAGTSPAPTAVKLCGDELAKKLPAITQRIKNAIAWAKDLGSEFACENKPAAVCRFPASHCDWGPELRFTVDPKAGLQLESVLELETSAMSESFIARQDKFVTEQVAKLRAKSCKK
jgi:hypothetical protein